MSIFLIFLILVFILLVLKRVFFRKSNNQKLNKFKEKFLSKESNIERIFLRDDEKTFSNPDINIKIGLYENQDNTAKKSNIHRARLSKFKKSKLNGEMLFIDEEKRIFKYLNGKKIYL